MGSWGTGTFDNDDAMDGLGALDEAGLEAVGEAIDQINAGEPDEPPDAFDCCCALAAAEVVAAIMGHPREDLPEAVTDWVAMHEDTPSARLASEARRAVARIRSNSELAETWEESPDAQAWQDDVKALEERLQD